MSVQKSNVLRWSLVPRTVTDSQQRSSQLTMKMEGVVEVKSRVVLSCNHVNVLLVFTVPLQNVREGQFQRSSLTEQDCLDDVVLNLNAVLLSHQQKTVEVSRIQLLYFHMSSHSSITNASKKETVLPDFYSVTCLAKIYGLNKSTQVVPT